MCGRTVCSRGPSDICRACGHQAKDGKWSQPRWRDPPGGQKYNTSYNVAPTSHTPVLLSRQHLTAEEQESCSSLESTEEPVTMETGVVMETGESEYVVQPMHWGLVPSWHTGDSKGTGYSMTNARSDSMLEKRSYKVPLEKGRRCVILADGYYEWQTKEGNKQPYYIYPPTGSQDKVKAEVKAEADEKVKVEADEKAMVKDEDNGSIAKEEKKVKSEKQDNKKLLMMAGLFDINKTKEGGPLYSYSIITVDVHPELAWLHHRMPALLTGEDEVQAWLDFGSVPLEKAVQLIKPRATVQYHPVDKAVGNAHNKSPDLVKPVDLEKLKAKASASSNLMAAWLGKAVKKDLRKRSVSESDKAGSKEDVGIKSEIKEEGDEPRERKKLKTVEEK